MHDLREDRDILTIAGFRIDVLNRRERAVLVRIGHALRPGGHIEQLFGIDRAIVHYRQDRRIAFRHETIQRIVFHRAHGMVQDNGPVERDLRRLARAAGEDHLAFPAQRALHPCPRVLQRLLRAASFPMRAARIGP